jgi:hypothetical protein
MGCAHRNAAVGTPALRLAPTGSSQGILEASHFEHTTVAHDGAPSFRSAALYHEGYQQLGSSYLPFLFVESRLYMIGPIEWRDLRAYVRVNL